MSEGTMQRRAQRDDQHDHRDDRDRRGRRTQRVGGLNRALAAAAVLPVMLVAVGCSSDSGSGSGSADANATQNTGADTAAGAGATVSAQPTVQAAAYKALPEACKALSKKTLTELVPKAGAAGKEGASKDTGARASCSWSSLQNNGVKGSQFRWLNVSLLRFESDAASSGDQQAQEYYAKQVKGAQAVSGAANAKTQALTGAGDQATTVRYDLKKTEGAFKQQTVVARVENVVVTLDYNGAGLAGDKTPSPDALTKSAEKAAKEVVAAVRSANGESANGGATGGGSATSPSPSKPSTSSPSPSASPSKPSASASAENKS
ncbi:DUF3558 domain-containing protein [Streptomyces sp. NPDC002328]|uniref:DUF3558 domain-containing protein n=1 Tax=Streptomyces sp. NPDC002328 TaxID=3364642 RepID=UPI0036D00037